jgi:hypothetical protein
MSLPHHLIPTRKHVASSPQPLSTPSPLSIPFLTAPLPAPSPVVFAAGLLDRAKAADISGLVPAGPKDPTPDAQRLEAERLALAQDSALRKAILSEANKLLQSKPFFREYEKLGGVTLLLEPFTVENHLLTMTLKMKRDAVVKRYGTAIDKMYGR